MARRSEDVLSIREMIRRFRLGHSDRAIDRKTVGSSRDWAERQALLDGEATPDEIAIAERL